MNVYQTEINIKQPECVPVLKPDKFHKKLKQSSVKNFCILSAYYYYYYYFLTFLIKNLLEETYKEHKIINTSE